MFKVLYFLEVLYVLPMLYFLALFSLLGVSFLLAFLFENWTPISLINIDVKLGYPSPRIKKRRTKH